MADRRNISITNEKVKEILKNSKNASKLIEEAVIFYDYAMKHNILYDQEVNRIVVQGLFKR